MVALALVVATVVLVGVAGALLRFVETWWGYRLVREPGGRLRIRRGLLTSRSISLDESRLRGVELAEPVLLRPAAAPGCTPSRPASGRRAAGARARAPWLPAAPIGEVERVAAAVLRDQRAPTDHADLRRHPRAALRRRLTRALVVGLVALGLAAAEVGATDEGVPPGVGGDPAGRRGVARAFAASYRSLGHAVEDRYLVVRRGALVRRTVACGARASSAGRSAAPCSSAGSVWPPSSPPRRRGGRARWSTSMPTRACRSPARRSPACSIPS